MRLTTDRSRRVKMKRTAAILVALALVLGLGGAATAGTFSLVPSVVPGCPAAVPACTSPVNNVFGFTFVGTTFSRTELGGDGVLSVGDSFTDIGALSATSLTSAASTPIIPALTGLNVNWQLGAIFSLPGTITQVVDDGIHSPTQPLLSFSFTAGSKIQIYAEPINLVTPHDPNNPTTIASNLVAELTVVSGLGNLDFLSNDGNINVLAQFTSILPGFWQNLGIDIDLGTQVFFALTDSNNNVLASVPASTATNFTTFFGLAPAAPTTSTLEQTWLSNDGSVEFAVNAVSNPSAIMLLGTSLLGLGSMAAYRRRRS
jgi:hypothetical protein